MRLSILTSGGKNNNMESQLLADIAKREDEISAEIPITAANDVFARYSLIHQEYSHLAENGNIEALKRSFFLQWLEAVEPSIYTGLAGLDFSVTQRVFSLLEEKVKELSLDTELEWMLPYYYLIAEYFFSESEFPSLVSYCKQHQPARKQPPPPRDAELEGRGRMGSYWRSIRDTQIRHKKKWKTDY